MSLRCVPYIMFVLLVISGLNGYCGNIFKDTTIGTFITSQKMYELTDHLGDMLAIVLDRRIGKTHYKPIKTTWEGTPI